MSESLKRLFLREKPVLALLAVGELKPAYAAMIAKRIDSTFPHTSSILSELEAHGLIRSRPEGRIRYLELTDRGKRIERALVELFGLLQMPNAHFKRLDKIRQLAASSEGEGITLRLGPLRRDLAKLKSLAEDEELQRAVQDLDAFIVAALKK
ncbi:MAG: winged helix DNA-binding protein [Methanothrix sp.]|nr:winged helix DNA-binding protein [Methanothrix sp.]